MKDIVAEGMAGYTATLSDLSTFSYIKTSEEQKRHYLYLIRGASPNEIISDEFLCVLSHNPEASNITFSAVRFSDHIVTYLNGQEWSNVST